MGSFSSITADAVADALGVPALDRGANVEGEILGLHESGRKFSGVQADVDLGIDAVQVIEHGHVLVEIVNGNIPVFGHDQVQSHKARIGGGEFEAEYDLREDGCFGQAAQHLVKVADGDVAAGFGVGRTAFQFGAGAGFVFRQSLAGRGGDFLQAAGQKLLAHFGEVVFPGQAHAELGGGASIGGVHEFDILHVFAGGAVDHGGDGLGDMVVRGQSELVEGGEEVVVAGLVAGAPVAHGPCVDDLVVEDVVVVGAADAGLRRVMFAGIAGGAQQAGRGAVDAEIVGCREVEKVLGVDRAIEVVVQIAALGDIVQESQ